MWHNVLNLGEITSDAYFHFLNEEYPKLVALYETLYRGKYVPKDYARAIAERFAEQRKSYPLEDRPKIEPRQGSIQLSLI